jgi:hypothetical protein
MNRDNKNDSGKEPNYVKAMTDGFRTAAVDAAFQSNCIIGNGDIKAYT